LLSRCLIACFWRKIKTEYMIELSLLGVAACLGSSNFSELRRIATAARLAPSKDFVKLPLRATVWVAFSPFVSKTSSLEDDQRGLEADKGLETQVGAAALREGSGNRDDEVGRSRTNLLRSHCALMARTVAPISAGRNQSYHGPDSDAGGRMLDDATQDDNCGAPIGKGLSSLQLCAGPEEMAKVIGLLRQGTV
jgi:hypothetical protein